jgi:hypothetical protein
MGKLFCEMFDEDDTLVMGMIDGSRGGNGSSALMPKAKHSKEKARLRPPLLPIIS